MKTLFRELLPTIALSFATAFSMSTKANTLLAVVSPYQSQAQVKNDIILLKSWLLKLPKGDSVIVLNGWDGNSIATLTRPVEKTYQAPKTIILRNRQGFGRLVQFAKTRATPTRTAGTLHLPRLLSAISQHYPQVEDVVFIGAANFDLPGLSESFVNGRTLPADSNLKKTSHEGLFGVSDVSERLKGKRFHFLLPKTITPYHYAQGVERFFHLYLHGQQGELITFSADKHLVTDRLFNKAASLPMRYELSRVSSPKPMHSLFTRAPSEGHEVNADQRQRVRIGIAWQGAADLDIYGLLQGEAKPVYYANTKTSHATHHKDIRSGTNQQTTTYEFITYHASINPCDLRIGVNRYIGSSHGVHGTLRVEVGDKLIAQPFRFSGSGGNKGQDMAKVLRNGTRSAHSQRFLLRDVVSIKGCA